MKISTTKPELQAALQKLSKATPTRSTLPILSNVLFVVEENETTLRTTDLEITISLKLAASVETAGSVCLPLQTLLNVTNEMPEEARITIIAQNDNKIEINTDVGSYDIVGKPADEFPATPEIDNRKSIVLKADILSELIQKTSFAVSKDELKPALSGVLFRFDEKAVTSVATDGHRLVKYIIEGTEGGGFLGDIIIPRKFLNLVGTLLTTAEEAKLWVGESHMTLAFENDVYYTRIIGEKFPDFDGVIPKDNDKELVIKRETLLSAVRRVSVFSNRSTQQIALVLSGEKLQVTTEDPEKASKGKESIEGKYKGEDITVGYNAGYLKDILSHLPTDEITIKLKTAISAALFYPKKETEKSNLTMLLMPIRLNEKGK